MSSRSSLQRFQGRPIRRHSARELRPESRLIARLRPASLERLQASSVAIYGTGTLGSLVALILGKLGINLVLVDPQRVGPENLATQMFKRGQVGLSKVEALVRNVLEVSPFSIEVLAFQGTFEEFYHKHPKLFREVDLHVGAVDSFFDRLIISDRCYTQAPCVFGGMAPTTTYGWVAWHKPPSATGTTPCLRCLMRGLVPRARIPTKAGCQGVILDLSAVIAGQMAFAALACLIGEQEPHRAVTWVLRKLVLTGGELGDVQYSPSDFPRCERCNPEQAGSNRKGGGAKGR